MRTLSVLPLLLILACSEHCFAQKSETSGKAKTIATEEAAPEAKSLAPNQVKSALAFASEHHAELAALLQQLRDTSPLEFERGIRAVNRSAQKLKRLQKKQPARHGDELEKWKRDSRIRLMTAQWAMSRDTALEEQIKSLLQKRQQTRAARLSATRQKMAQRLKQIDEQIVRVSREGAVSEEWTKLKKRATAQKANGRSHKSGKKDDTNADE